ncbi:HEAT repeat family protein [Histomonas meleagridis]|uniref:HEAT repeat family protein n=1 Tax=Histomonas meleagridis TaxID=135588 RepID=UPI0035595F6F|nr:HEAT repeat family protein [Histomonas meleagridis]KAH0800173.1 HEAT repeat family protein [Histomonas meleagridis]
MEIASVFSGILPIISTLSKDPLSKIRGMLPSMIDSYIGKIKDKNLAKQLYDIIAILSKDKVPYVRLKVTEALYQFSLKMDENSRMEVIDPIVSKVITDDDASVRTLAISRLAPVMSTFGEKVSKNLVSKYSEILLSGNQKDSYATAFCFSAVALSIGRERFRDELLPSFRQSLHNNDKKIKRTLSFALIALTQLFEPSELQEFVELILNDLPFVAIGVMSNLSDFLEKIVDVNKILPFLLEPLSKYPEWRMRLQVSIQLRKCKSFFPNEKLIESAYSLIGDKIAAVRNDATTSFAELMTEKDLHYINVLAKSDNHWDRLCAAEIMKKMNPMFIHLVQDSLDLLLADHVFSVQNTAKSIKNGND